MAFMTCACCQSPCCVALIESITFECDGVVYDVFRCRTGAEPGCDYGTEWPPPQFEQFYRDPPILTEGHEVPTQPPTLQNFNCVSTILPEGDCLSIASNAQWSVSPPQCAEDGHMYFSALAETYGCNTLKRTTVYKIGVDENGCPDGTVTEDSYTEYEDISGVTPDDVDEYGCPICTNGCEGSMCFSPVVTINLLP